ncbi:hypothetical protein [Nostoc sp.]|uniref:hypothetical protein n=1 Tax=Nostoc sp. TaxID=1180 RepID=UPI002FF4ABEB
MAFNSDLRSPTAGGYAIAQPALHSIPGRYNGVEHFFGFLDRLKHPQTPHILYEDNKPISVNRYPNNFLTTDYWTQTAIALLKQAKTKSTDKLFFLYFANNGVHSTFYISVTKHYL